MPGLPDCRICPFRDDPDWLCWCAEKGFVSICSGAAGQRNPEQMEGFRAIIIEKTTGYPPPDDGKPVRRPSDPAPPPPPIPRYRVNVSPKAALDILRLRAAKACSARGPAIGDGCNCRYPCSLGHGWFEAGEVTDQQCMECVQGRPPARNAPES